MQYHICGAGLLECCVFLCRYYEQGGFSTLAVDNLDVEMGEILSRVIRKRRLQIHGVWINKLHVKLLDACDWILVITVHLGVLVTSECFYLVPLNKFSFYCMYFDCFSVQLYHSYIDCMLQFLASVQVSLEWLLALSTSPIQHPDRMLVCITPLLCRLWARETGQTWSGCGPQKYPGESGNTGLYSCEECWCVLSIGDESMELWISVFSCCVPGRRVGTSGSTGSDSPDSPLGTRRVQTTVRAELTSHQYKVWNEWLHIPVSHFGNRPKRRLTLFTRWWTKLTFSWAYVVAGKYTWVRQKTNNLLGLMNLSPLLCSQDSCFCSHVHVVCVSFLSLPIVFTNFCFSVFTVLSCCYDPQGAIKYWSASRWVNLAVEMTVLYLYIPVQS